MSVQFSFILGQKVQDSFQLKLWQKILGQLKMELAHL